MTWLLPLLANVTAAGVLVAFGWWLRGWHDRVESEPTVRRHPANPPCHVRLLRSEKV